MFPVRDQVQMVSKSVTLRVGRVFILAVCAISTTFSAAQESALAPPKSAFTQFVDEVWKWEIQEDPWLAMEVGEPLEHGRLPSDKMEDLQRRFETRTKFLERLQGFDPSSLSTDDRINREVLRHRLNNSLSSYQYKSHFMPINGREGFHVSFGQLANSMKLESARDYEVYVETMADFARYTDEQIALMKLGIAEGYTIPSIVLRDIGTQLDGLIGKDSRQSELFKPFTLSRPTSISESQWVALKEQAAATIEQTVAPAYLKFRGFLVDEYLPNARTSLAARALPNGKAFYQDRVEHFTTLSMSAAEVHQVGLNEVSRIRAEMEEVKNRIGFNGTLSDFVKSLQKDEKNYAKTQQELMQYVALILKRIDGALPKLFSTLPRTPYGLKEIPAFVAPQTTSAYYFPPAGDGTRAGFFYLNTYNLPQRPKFEMEALALHEAVPGHHLQIALQQELPDVHPLRRFAMLTAYVEGWALYAELLGKEIGMYEDPYQDFGRLSFEAWRACRLVVDTGIHDLSWTREQAIAFMRENTALSDHNIAAEVDRYIGWPGQALGYKIGQMKILELRRKAESTLGQRFDLREFHHQVLSQGAVPLTILEEQIQNWISQKD